MFIHICFCIYIRWFTSYSIAFLSRGHCSKPAHQKQWRCLDSLYLASCSVQLCMLHCIHSTALRTTLHCIHSTVYAALHIQALHCIHCISHTGSAYTVLQTLHCIYCTVNTVLHTPIIFPLHCLHCIHYLCLHCTVYTTLHTRASYNTVICTLFYAYPFYPTHFTQSSP